MTNTLVLFHGSSVGWIHLSGFQKNDFFYGELASEASFVYLCSNNDGAVSAAYKACAQVRSRNSWEDPDQDTDLSWYKFNGERYDFSPYEYRIEFDDTIRVLDLNSTSLSSEETSNIKRAIFDALINKIEVRNEISRTVKYFFTRKKIEFQFKYGTKGWKELLFEAYGRSEFIKSLHNYGFDIVRNFHGDNDSQNYGEVWVLPMSSYGLAKISTPIKHKLYPAGKRKAPEGA